MHRIIDRKIYDTETAKQIHATTVSTANIFLETTTYEILCISPNGRPFVASWNEDRTTEIGIKLLDPPFRYAIEAWLERYNAPESAYKAAGIETAEG